MRLVLLGPPGAGKGTHAAILAKKYRAAHLATGDILRNQIREKTSLGMKAKDIIEKGELVPDALVNAMMFEELRESGREKGWILDGYPRTIGQAEGLDRFLKTGSKPLDAVLNFTTSEKVIIDRLSGRRVCGKCGANFHIRNIPPKKEGVCDRCGGQLTQRKDDSPETIRRRLETYEKETKPLVDYYAAQGMLHEVQADRGIPALQDELKKLFDNLNLVA